MGFGDCVMATGQVRALNIRTGKKVMITNAIGKQRWSEVYEHNPRITTNIKDDHVRLINGGGARPYIAGKTTTQWMWKRWDNVVGEIFLSDEERAWAEKYRAFGEPFRGIIMIEPNTKVVDGNKSWPFERWQEVVNALPGLVFVQATRDYFANRLLKNVVAVETPTFRHAMALLSVSRAFVGCEGGLHHAAAALNVPAVVLWSHFIAPEFTGYKTQKNIRHATGWCGFRVPCEQCARSMRAIEVREVVESLETIL